MAEQNNSDEDQMKILFPTGIGQSSGECTVLVQINPEDASTLDFTGATGAIGRLEADDTGVSFDFKGVQYKGRFFPTATTMVLSVVNGKENYLKIDGIADDFCYLEKTGDALKGFDAQAVGNLSGYDVQDEDVNRYISSSGNHEGAPLPPVQKSEVPKSQAKRSITKKSNTGSAHKKMKRKS
ncbi:hypothetical protein FisN_5Lh319 [Fistulifera solaris]|uniref:Uncharacterized protein n=1 Tax=Fistulifera solaris TaxID=1519565 RepID=A0A1Z5KG92_FISSO|nr:hypothetical protein FisN_5Lh319 [Fistulifera solaris]|eukprot:GAX25237.1 hypothetical protein FisN_5Lh319 [Fistulifera solaris]